ncbi:uncharacterized protein PSFLO_03124 [Pseudozyma flocculosa]|uniref:Meiotically up-regulated protein Msb1/Mug8 domain-containing protein n=2 Tax=Pseudozyma flocculosa TaxID=84751 RepID=A0A5C3EZJ7_9BASI|nr:uncharacterized protein PSFLO_03124 [Pseudozyma flocculosa]
MGAQHGIAAFRSKFKKASPQQPASGGPAAAYTVGNQSSIALGESGQSRKRGFSLRSKMRLGKPQRAPAVPQLPPALELDFDRPALDAPSQPEIGAHARPSPTPGAAQPPTAAALVAAEAIASSSSATKHVPRARQLVKALEAMANARLDVAQVRDLASLCAEQIKQRGLDTTGLFRSFRVAQSQDDIDRLIQLFLVHINPTAYASVFAVLPDDALARLWQRPEEAPDKSRAALDELEKELRYTSIHNVVALLKWGLRHLRLRTTDFNSSDPYGWYDAFVAAEKKSGYHPRAIADLLHPTLPQETAELLVQMLELMARVAAHHNHMPASEICSILGFWLFGRIGVAHPPPTFPELQAAWQTATSVAEHLLLAHIRSQAVVTFAMPLRLTELVQDYPSIKDGSHSPGFPPAYARRQVSTLRIDLRSENLVVSPMRPRLPSATLASALDASASEQLEGGRGETWAAVIGQLASDATEGDKGKELLIPEHARILDLVDAQIAARIKHQEQAEEASRPPAFGISPSSAEGDRDSLSPQSTYRRFSRSYSDLRSTKPLATLSEDEGPGGASRERRPRPPPLAASAASAARVSRDASVSQQSTEGGPPPATSTDSAKFKRLSTEWRSFSEGGFSSEATAVELSLDEFDLKPVSSNNSQTLPSRKGAARRSGYSGGSLGRRRSNRGELPAFGLADAAPAKPPPPPAFVVTSVAMTAMDTSLTTLWQDSLLDNSLCSTLPPLVLVQLDEKVAAEADLLGGYAKDERPWLLVVETVLPPRPPTPTDDGNKGRGGRGDGHSISDSRSIFAPSIRSVKLHLQRRMSMLSSKSRTKRAEANDVAEVQEPPVPKTPVMPGGWT